MLDKNCQDFVTSCLWCSLNGQNTEPIRVGCYEFGRFDLMGSQTPELRRTQHVRCTGDPKHSVLEGIANRILDAVA